MIYLILTYFLPIALVLCTLFIAYFNWVYNYWKRLGVPYMQPVIPYGNAKETVKGRKTSAQTLEEVYTKFKPEGHMYAGYFLFHMPVFVAIDLDLIKHVLQSDFQHFMGHGSYYNEKNDPLSANLFSLDGEKWKKLRMKLTPTFTSGRMKMMFPIMIDISKKLVKAVEKYDDTEKVEVKAFTVRFTTDVIGCVAFGIDCNSLDDPDNEFCKQGKRIFNFTNIEMARTFFSFLFPDLARTLGLRMFPKVSSEFFWKVIEDNANHREMNNIRRNDFFQLLLDLKNETSGGEKLTFQELAAQAVLFFFAGYETSSLTMTLALYELARNEKIQHKLREEIKAVMLKHDGKLTYEGLAEMHYMDMVVKETLRKYPALPSIGRVCNQEYKVPNSEIVLEKGLKVFIPIEAIHYDPEYYPSPQEFDPERFTEENVGERHHFAYLPFGEGPRICIGMRFGTMQTKVGLAALIKNYKLTVNPDTEPIRMSPTHFFNYPANPIWVDFEKI